MPINRLDVLLYEKKGKIAYLTINRPEAMNSLSLDVKERFAKVWADFNDDDALFVAILTGAGDKSFCTGGDLAEVSRVGIEEFRRLVWDGIPGAGLHVGKPIIAAINGYAVGAGWFLAQQCDIRIAAEDVELGIPEVRRGIAAPWVGGMLRHVGIGHALELALTGERINAQRAYEIGFVNKVVPRKDLMSTATALAERICENGPLAIRAEKQILWQGLAELSRSEIRGLAENITAPVYKSEDLKEGTRAFLERRKPNWKGS